MIVVSLIGAVVSSLSDVVWISLVILLFVDEETPIVVLIFISVGDAVTFLVFINKSDGVVLKLANKSPINVGFVVIGCVCTEV